MYETIIRAGVEMSYDVGGINRDRSEVAYRSGLAGWLLAQSGPGVSKRLSEIDAWLAGLSAADFDVVCSGEQTDRQRVLQSAPPGTDDFLNDVFEAL